MVVVEVPLAIDPDPSFPQIPEPLFAHALACELAIEALREAIQLWNSRYRIYPRCGPYDSNDCWHDIRIDV
jgi:hypothetical protein